MSSKGHSNVVSSVAFSADGKTLATGSYDETVRLWDVASGQCTATLEVHHIDMSSFLSRESAIRITSDSKRHSDTTSDPKTNIEPIIFHVRGCRLSPYS